MSSDYHPDKIDRQIIELLRENSQISKENIAKKVEISRQTVQKRIKNLIDQKILLKHTIVIDDRKLGKGVTAFVMISLDRSRRMFTLTQKELILRLKELEILEMHHITGQFDVLLKIVTRNLDSLEDHIFKITEISGVARTQTMICFSSYEHGFKIGEELHFDQPTEILWNFT